MIQIPKSLPIKKIIVENPFVKTFVFEHRLNSKPGQFVNLWIPRVDEKPMSIAYDDGNEFWISMFAVGNFSKHMHHLKVGDLVGVRGPYGKPFTFEKRQHLVMMAGGYGAAPLYYLTKKAIEQECTVDFVVGARGKDYLLYLDRIRELKNVTLYVTTDDGSVGEKGYNTLVLERLIGEVKSQNSKVKDTGQKLKVDGVAAQPSLKAKNARLIDCVYTCGPELMMKRISDICFENNVKAQLTIERYMKCGFGVCGQCCVDTKGERMCMEGTVVENDRAREITEFGKYHRDAQGKMHNF